MISGVDMTFGVKRVAIIHPWMPHYRKAFFERLIEALRRDGVVVDVFFGDVPREWVERNDAILPEGMTKLDTRFFPLFGRNLSVKSLRELRSRGPYDLVIVEQAIRNIETYRLLMPNRIARAIAFWGHGRTYTLEKGPFEERFKQFLTRRGSWFFGYTNGGVDSVVSNGFARDRTTVVNNSIDTASLKSDLAGVEPGDLKTFCEELGLTDDTFLYMGGIDEAKRIPFLLDACRKIYRERRSFRIVLVGDGDMSPLIREIGHSEPWLKYVGPQFGAEKALAIRAAKALLIPGRVGLIAVDSLVSGCPIVTTRWPFHAPEFEYLEDGVTAVVADDSVNAYVREVVKLIDNPGWLRSLSENCVRGAESFSAESMAANFAEGIRTSLQVSIDR